MNRPNRRTVGWMLFVMILTQGCGKSEAERRQEEERERRNRAAHAEQVLPGLKEAQLTNTVNAAMEAVRAKEQAALGRAVAELKGLGAPAVGRLQQRAREGKKADRVAALTVLGEMGTEAGAAAPALEGIVKVETDPELKEAAEKALAKV